MKRVIIESPYAGAISENLRYLRECLRHSLKLGEAPFASHGLYTQEGVLRDNMSSERTLGVEAGYAWWNVADLIVFYTDNGWSAGMVQALDKARMGAYLYNFRSLKGPTFIKPPPP